MDATETLGEAAAGAVCIRAPNWVGDVVMATPAFRCIRAGFPAAHTVLVIRDAVADVVRGAPWFDETIVYRRAGLRAAGEFMRCASRVRKAHCTLAFIMPNSFSSALMMWMAGVPTRVGYLRDARALLLTRALPRPSHEDGSFRPIYMADYYMALCETMGLVSDSRRMELPLTEADMDAARAILDRAGVDLGRPFFLLHPGAGYGPSKRWPTERYAVLAAMLQREFDAQVACIGGPDVRPLAALIRRGSRATVLDLTDCGVTLHMLKGVVRLSDLLVTTDSGPRHYGIALGVPTVCLMGPTKPEYTASRQPNDIVVRVDVPCGPCQKKRCRSDHRCMDHITAEMVLEACRTALPMGGRRADDQT